MKVFISIVSSMAAVLLSLLTPAPSFAYTIASACVPVTFQPSFGAPTNNVVCSYHWQEGGSALVIKGDWEAHLAYWGNHPFQFPPINIPLDQVVKPQFFFSGASGFYEVYIACANQIRWHQLTMGGYSYRLVPGSTPPYYQADGFTSDGEGNFISEPLVTCP